MKKILDILFGPQTIFYLFFVGMIMFVVTVGELKIFKIPEKYYDGIWLGNIILTFLVYFISVWAKKKD